MTNERYEKLSDLDSGEELTPEEIHQGWHFCMSEWDGLLIGPGMHEFMYCKCAPFKEEDLTDSKGGFPLQQEVDDQPKA